ncbi:unnamed protein product [Acanthoscelides obtectus]|uniref:Uncharacterized protein n=1 Tax=Acanthoscelides obtectus TaxID=200917 RepID=A0A9P0M3M6_ACAOB|nr:unnamed protein product [Acanthoscelides obtectus]CAK1627591.1 hypothetical protein AOBTE_LOCUS4689 [Acanthoscelides obtectus]
MLRRQRSIASDFQWWSNVLVTSHPFFDMIRVVSELVLPLDNPFHTVLCSY